MTTDDALERHLAEGLAGMAASGAPDYLDDVLRRSSRTRQWHAWTSPERWLPMTIILRRPLLSPPMRLLAVGLALLLAVGATVAGAALLSRILLPAVVTLDHPRGLIAFEREGAVWTYDPETKATERIADEAWGPSWSPDGRSLFFWRLDGANDMPMVLDMTTPGATPVALADTPVLLPANIPMSMSWGPDGTLAATITPAGLSSLPSIAFLRTGETATGPLATLPGGSTDSPAFRPEAGGTRGPTLLYRAHPTRAQTTLEIGSVSEQSAPSTVLSTKGIDTSVGPVSTGYAGEFDLIDPQWAPPALDDTGAIRPIAYFQLHDLPPAVDSPGGAGMRAHIFDGTDRVLVGDPNADDEGWPRWDPTGERVAILSFEEGTTDEAPGYEGRLIIMAADGDPDGAVVTTVPVEASPTELWHTWSPDGTQLLLLDRSGSGLAWMVDAATGTMELLPITSDGQLASWGQPVE